MTRRPLAAALLAVLLPAGCGGRGGPGAPAGGAESDRAFVTVEKVAGHAAPSGLSPVLATLRRGAEVKVVDARDGFWRVQPSAGGEVWVEAGSFERKNDREAREKRAADTKAFPPQPGRAVESAPILLAPAYGAARWGDVDDGDDVEVLLHDHDFYGIRLSDARLAFVPARAIRLLPSAVPGSHEAPPRRQIVPEVRSLGDPGVVGAVPAAPPVEPPIEPPARRSGAEAPLESLPQGAEPPSLVVRVDPNYPESARRLGVSGEVVLRIVVTAEGTVGKVDVVTGAPAGLTEAAVDAVARWRYRPARLGDRPVSVVKLVRVRFAPSR